MKKEELLSIGLTEEQADKVFAMNGKDIERHKKAAEDAKADKEAVEKQLADRDKDIEDLRKSSGDAESVRKQPPPQTHGCAERTDSGKHPFHCRSG